MGAKQEVDQQEGVRFLVSRQSIGHCALLENTAHGLRLALIGYNRAASIMERVEKEGIVGPANHAGKRKILLGGFQDRDE
jgi:hypothetical protein